MAPEQAVNESQHSLDPILAAVPKRTYTVQSFTSPPDRLFEYEKVELGDASTPNHAQTFGQSPEGPKQAIRTGFWPNSYKLLPHFAAGAISVAVVQLSFRNEYW
ncbi:hypothetical protein A1O7_06691 [Cladophialophora yegresii CBS 114405]|uniref:Uncharacterized protein n=1 Tax=Cladophialophora yegresii CBS 114405 TaxID=1182544 RepID=W9WLA8_9EURO|nr:uncharacterized protein A1O7_06691 [Cladophialophora yegresii CBS 114405]EXJ59259.1 hypothetical protein A1O7_06691 [Cladophialophora yegresii CBS 114405]